MSLYFFQPVGITDDLEVEAPVVIYARLPQVASFIVFFCAKRRMTKVDGKKSELFLADLSFFLAACLRRKLALSDAIASAAVLNGP